MNEGVRMKRRRTAKIVLGVTFGVLLTRVLLSFCAVGLFFHFFYARSAHIGSDRPDGSRYL